MFSGLCFRPLWTSSRCCRSQRATPWEEIRGHEDWSKLGEATNRQAETRTDSPCPGKAHGRAVCSASHVREREPVVFNYSYTEFWIPSTNDSTCLTIKIENLLFSARIWRTWGWSECSLKIMLLLTAAVHFGPEPEGDVKEVHQKVEITFNHAS